MTLVFGINSTMIVLGIGVVIAIVIVVAFIAVKKARAAKRENLHKITADQFRIPLHVQNIPTNNNKVSPDPYAVAASTPDPNEINCIHGMTDIYQSLLALAEKYSLDEITLATSDGLLLATSSRKPAVADIARYCEAYTANPRARSPGILLFGVEHKGSSLVGIAKTKGPDLQEPGEDLVRDTKDILNWWI